MPRPGIAEKLRRKGSQAPAVGCCSRCGPASPSSASSRPIRDLAARAWPFAWGGWETFWVLFYGFATWGNAGFLREQVCKYMCPYARFQSAMFDRNTLIIAYDPMRGEPRGARKRGLASVLQRARGLLDKLTAYDYVFRASQHPDAPRTHAPARAAPSPSTAREAEPLPQFAPEQLGDCVDCTICVQVCPTGIDIRNGLQYECIACGACIDGCNEVMDKLGYPQGPDPLFHAERHRRQAHAHPAAAHHRLRPLLLALALGLGLGRHASQPVHRRSAARPQCAVPRDRATARSRTRYTLKMVNKTDQPARFAVTLQTARPARSLVGMPGADRGSGRRRDVRAAAHRRRRATDAGPQRSWQLEVTSRADMREPGAWLGTAAARWKAVFFAPGERHGREDERQRPRR